MADSRTTIDRQRAGYRLLAEAVQVGAIDFDKLPPGRQEEIEAVVTVKRGRPKRAPALSC